VETPLSCRQGIRGGALNDRYNCQLYGTATASCEMKCVEYSGARQGNGLARRALDCMYSTYTTQWVTVQYCSYSIGWLSGQQPHARHIFRKAASRPHNTH
jgi:hypothetical protein